MTGPIWIVLCVLVAAGRPCVDQVYAQSVDTPQLCMLVAGDISRIYEGSNHPRCVFGPKPDLPDISFTAADRYG